MKKLLTAFIIGLSATVSLANVTQMTDVENANYMCTDINGSTIIAVDTANKRVWQTEVGQEDVGLELAVTNFTPSRCPYCFNIAAEHRFPAEFSSTGSTLPHLITISATGDADYPAQMSYETPKFHDRMKLRCEVL